MSSPTDDLVIRSEAAVTAVLDDIADDYCCRRPKVGLGLCKRQHSRCREVCYLCSADLELVGHLEPLRPLLAVRGVLCSLRTLTDRELCSSGR